jgi:Ca2+-binding EF-hand superfamily protein
MGNLIEKRHEIYTILTDELLKRCRTITGLSDNDIHNEHRKFFTIAVNGRLKESHMNDLLSDYLPSTKRKHSKYLSRCIFSAIDTNNDGYIDFLEYLMSMKFFRTTSPIDKADFVFRIIDSNGDHVVTRKELKRILKCLEIYHCSSANVHVNDGIKPIVDVLIDKLDEDKSGTIGVSEFIDGWLKDETIRELFTF